jgi:hypothetical protein
MLAPQRRCLVLLQLQLLCIVCCAECLVNRLLLLSLLLPIHCMSGLAQCSESAAPLAAAIDA